jgi:hypothetical protein
MIDTLLSGGSNFSLRAGILTLLFAYWVYAYFQRRREHEVYWLLDPLWRVCSLTRKQADIIFGERHGCVPIEKKLPYKWPLALDIFKRQYDAAMSGNLLAFQAAYFDEIKVGQTFQLKLLGQVGYFTTDPKNIEAIVSTNFEGMWFPMLCLTV